MLKLNCSVIESNVLCVFICKETRLIIGLTDWWIITGSSKITGNYFTRSRSGDRYKETFHLGD